MWENEEASEPESVMAKMLELQLWLVLLRALMEKVDNTQESMANVTRDGNSKKGPRISSDQKQCDGNEECLWWAH